MNPDEVTEAASEAVLDNLESILNRLKASKDPANRNMGRLFGEISELGPETLTSNDRIAILTDAIETTQPFPDTGFGCGDLRSLIGECFREECDRFADIVVQWLFEEAIFKAEEEYRNKPEPELYHEMHFTIRVPNTRLIEEYSLRR